jgi:DNA-binding GntR family transcriptional regulator
MNESRGPEFYKDMEEERTAAKTMVETVFEQIREDILSGRLAPGDKLRVEQLRSAYGVGSSTLREALSRLVSELLVTVEGQRGFRVAPVSLADFRAIAEMRKLLETKALAQSIETGDDNWEAGIVAAFHRLSRIEERVADSPEQLASEWEKRNRIFHRALIAGCNNHWLFHFRSILLSQSGRYLRLALTDRTVPRDVHAEHTAIKDATLNRDVKLACRLSEEHIDRTVEVISALADRWEKAHATS